MDGCSSQEHGPVADIGRMTLSLHRPPRRLLAGLIAAVPLLLAAPAAHAAGGPVRHAAMLSPLHTVCQSEALEQPFANWGDDASYFLTRDGDVGDAAAWELDGAQVNPENNPFSTHGDQPSSLQIDTGQSATTADVCVSLEDPTMRFFARDVGADAGVLHVDVIYQDAYGEQIETEIGHVDSTAGADWAPSPIVDLTAPLVDVLGNDLTPVQFRFWTDGDGGSWLVDDVYVDPYGKG
jgi:hypothetical protein